MLHSRRYLIFTLLTFELFTYAYPLSGQEDTEIFKSGEHATPSHHSAETNDTNENETQHSSQQNVGIFESSEHLDPSNENAAPTKTTEKMNAKKEEPAIKVSGGVAFISDYRSRGLSQTMRRPAVQGEITFTHKSGVYFKNWGSNVNGAKSFLNDASLEWDIYLGYEHKILKSEFKFDVGFEYYYYPGARAAVPRQISYDTLEYYVALSYKGFNIRLNQTLTDFFAINSHNPPVNAQFALMDTLIIPPILK